MSKSDPYVSSGLLYVPSFIKTRQFVRLFLAPDTQIWSCKEMKGISISADAIECLFWSVFIKY